MNQDSSLEANNELNENSEDTNLNQSENTQMISSTSDDTTKTNDFNGLYFKN